MKHLGKVQGAFSFEQFCPIIRQHLCPIYALRICCYVAESTVMYTLQGGEKPRKQEGKAMKKTIIRENLSIEDAKNVAEELKLYGYKVEITGEGKRRTVTATRE